MTDNGIKNRNNKALFYSCFVTCSISLILFYTIIPLLLGHHHHRRVPITTREMTPRRCEVVVTLGTQFEVVIPRTRRRGSSKWSSAVVAVPPSQTSHPFDKKLRLPIISWRFENNEKSSVRRWGWWSWWRPYGNQSHLSLSCPWLRDGLITWLDGKVWQSGTHSSNGSRTLAIFLIVFVTAGRIESRWRWHDAWMFFYFWSFVLTNCGRNDLSGN